MTRAGELTSRIVTDISGWEALRPWWDVLLEASPDSTPWQSWDYLWCWWHTLGADKQLRIIVVERHGVPVQVFPMQITRETMIGVPTRLIEPITMMWDVNRPRFALGGFDPVAFRLGLETLWTLRDEWDSIRIEELPMTDWQAQELKAFAASRGLWFRDVLSSVCPYLRLDQPWPKFLQSRGARLRKNLRLSRNRLEEFGPVRLEVHERPEDVARAFDVVLGLHRRSWKRRKYVGLSLSVGYREFFRAFLLNMAARGQGRVLVLRAGNRAVAATIALLHRDTYFSTEIVHDAEFARCSPGTLLEAIELERLMNAPGPLRHYDFLGRFLSNKQRWTATARVTHRIYVFRPRLATAFLDLHYFKAKPLVKRAWRAVFGLSKGTAQALRFVSR
jgi:CelD/BcsL family acetyltransferase involved in cellulose biosynthesis